MAPVLEVANIFRRHGEAFRQAHAGHLGCVERRIMGAITACRTAALGGHVEQCDDCGATRIAYNSCRNRHCPKCQGAARERWLAERRGEVLPIPYFHVVFTLPPAAAEIAFQNKAAVYAILFRSAAAALMKLAANPRHLEAELGILAVLHTLGADTPASSPHPLRHTWRRTLARWTALGVLQAWVLPARPSLGTSLPRHVPRRTGRRLRGRRSEVLRRSHSSRRAAGLRPAPRRSARRRLGRLRQAAVRGARTGARLSGALHPPRRHRQQPHRVPR